VDHLQADLLGRSLRGGAVTLGAQLIKVAAQACAIVVLARLLAPGDFGRFAMVAVFLTALEVFKDLGLSTAMVQRREVSPDQIDTLFWLNVGLGAAATALTVALGPLLALMFREPELDLIASAVAAAFLFTGLSVQHLALLRRQMRFTTLATVQVSAEVVGIAAAIGAAFTGVGIWALVVQRLAWAAATAAGAWIACDWRPGRPGPLRDVRTFVKYGGNATGAMTVGYLAGSLDKMLIGWYWGAVPLGLFERSQKLILLPIQNLNLPLANVAIAALSRLCDQPARYRETYLATIERLAMVTAPLGGFLVAAAGPVVDLALGPRWSEAAPILAWMGVTAIYIPVTYALSWLYMSQDRTREMLQASVVSAALMIVAILCGLPFGPVGVAAAFAISGTVIRAPVLFWLVGRDGPVRARDFYLILAAPAAGGAAVAAVAWAARRWLPLDGMSTTAEVAILAALGIASALAVYFLFPRSRRAVRSLGRLALFVRRLRSRDTKSAATA
jgi:PST family polysaccharide transporter